MLERLGIVEPLRAKTILASRPDREDEMPGAFVAAGRAEIALHQTQELIAVAGIEVVGPLPADLRGAFLFSAGLLTRSMQWNAAGQLLDTLISAATQALIARTGMEPASR